MQEHLFRSILLVDDSETFLMYVGILVKRLGYKTYLARDGAEAIKLAQEKKPSIIVLDYHMPRIDGTSCLSIIRKDKHLSNTPVIMLTSDVKELTKEECEQLGCCKFLSKPINIDVFYNAIQSCLQDEKVVADKRRNIRALSSFKVFIECQDERREVYAANLSVQGVFLRTADPFKIGTEIKIVFYIDEEDPIELKARVLYVNQISTELDREPGMGVLFQDVPEDVKLRLSAFIMEQIADGLIVEENTINNEIGFEDPFSENE